VIEYGEFERLGSGETLTVDVRVIAATNVDLPTGPLAGSPRRPARPAGFEVLTVPPLRARPEDIPLLAGVFGHDVRASSAARFAGSPRRRSTVARSFLAGQCARVEEPSRKPQRLPRRAARPSGPRGGLDPFDSPWRAPPRPGAPPAPVCLRPRPPDRSRRHLAEEERRLIEGALDRHRTTGARRGRARSAYDQLRPLRLLAIDAAA